MADRTWELINATFLKRQAQVWGDFLLRHSKGVELTAAAFWHSVNILNNLNHVG